MPRDARAFRRVARLLLPDEFWHRFGQPLVQTVVDQRQSLSPQRPVGVVAFWSRELAGLVVTVARERTGARRATAVDPARVLGEE